MWKLLLPLLAIAIASPPAFAQQVITFDELSTTGSGQGGQLRVFSQYASRGVTFNGPVALDYSKGLPIPGFAHSGSIAIEQCYAEEFCSTPIQMDFTTGQARVRLWVGSSQRLSVNRIVLVRAYDSNGTVVATGQTVLPLSTAAVPIRNPVELQVSTAVIRRVTVSYDPPTLFTNGLAIDDVEFSSEGPPPPCLAADVPAILLQSPEERPVSRNKFLLEGSVDGRGGTLSSAALAVTSDSGATRTLNLLGGIIRLEGGPFGAVWITDMLSAGENTITLAIANCRGVTRVSRTVRYFPISPNARFGLLHMEVTQATQTMAGSVVLIANKPTVVRAYLRITGQTTAIRDVGGVLTATRPDGSRPPGPISVRALRTVIVDTNTNVAQRRLTIGSSLNFRIPEQWLGAGRLHFEISKLEISGDQSTLPCDGCDNDDAAGFPVFVEFERSRRLNILLAPYSYEPSGATPKTPELVVTPPLVLQWVNNVFPLAGNYPDNELGLNLVGILPLRATHRDLTKDGEKAKFLEDLSVVRSKWLAANPGVPSDTHVLAIVPCDCGGAGALPGYVAVADTRATGQTAATGLEDEGHVWAHELGHNLGRKHVSYQHPGENRADSRFPYDHGGIGEPGLAITAAPWYGVPRVLRPGTLSSHTHDFMSYGMRAWVSPYTFEALHLKLRPSTLAALTGQTEQLSVSGSISPELAVTIRAASRETTRAVTGSGNAGEFTLRLLDAAGKVLHSHGFDAAQTGDSVSGHRTFAEFVPWRAGTRQIVVERGGVPLARRQVSAHAPEVTMLSPRAGDAAENELVVAWTGADRDGDSLTYTVFVNAGEDLWLPVATDLEVTSYALDTRLLPGTTGARVRVQANDGVNSGEAVTGPFTIPSKPPMVAMRRVTAPEGDYLFGIAYQPGAGYRAADALTWSSDRDGVLGQGSTIALGRLSTGAHRITLRVKDRNDQEHVDELRVEITQQPRRPQ